MEESCWVRKGFGEEIHPYSLLSYDYRAETGIPILATENIDSISSPVPVTPPA
jgi:hypothetical protein